MKGVRAAGVLVVLGMIISAILGTFRFGGGSGTGEGTGTEQAEEVRTQDVRTQLVQPEPKSEREPKPSQTPAVLLVRIEGSRYLVDGEEMRAEQIARLAADRKDAEGNPAPATVKVQRALDATRGAREALVAELREHNLLYQVE